MKFVLLLGGSSVFLLLPFSILNVKSRSEKMHLRRKYPGVQAATLGLTRDTVVIKWNGGKDTKKQRPRFVSLNKPASQAALKHYWANKN